MRVKDATISQPEITARCPETSTSAQNLTVPETGASIGGTNFQLPEPISALIR